MKILKRISNISWSVMACGVGALSVIAGLECIKYGKECFNETFE